jgi:putative FmdB family regulatory protein
VPIYGYRCDNCGHQLEVLQKVSDEPLKVCPNCQGQLRKMLYPAGVIFKGSGFYSTDYKGSGKGASANGSSGSSEGATEGRSDAKSEPKPETKTESKSESRD